MNRLLFPILAALLFTACSSSDPQPAPPPAPNAEHGVFICNEGNFTYDNASLSFYDPQRDAVTPRIALSYNGQPFPLGDVCHSMAIRNGRGFVVVNNSSKIYVIDAATNAYIGKITGLTSPRYVEFLSDTKAYVSDLYDSRIAIVNPQTLATTGYVEVGGSTERMVQAGGFVYAVSWSYQNKLYKIDPATDRVVASVEVGRQPNTLVVDRNQKLWVLADGGLVGTALREQPSLLRIDPADLSVEARFTFSESAATPTFLSIDAAGGRLYFLQSGTQADGVYSMDITAAALPAAPFIAEGGRLFRALGVDPRQGDLYVSDAIDYIQKGIIFRYSAAGTPLSNFKTDIIPGYFCFK